MPAAGSSRQSLFRRPIVHFVIGGVLLFAFDRLWWSAEEPASIVRAPIVIDVAQLRDAQTKALGRAPTEAEERGLLRQEIDQELLYRDALARGLDEGDRAIRAWLIRKMRFVSDDPERSDEELYQEALALGLDRGDAVVRRSLVEKMRLLAGLLSPPEEPTEEELGAYRDRHAEVFREPPRLSIEHVFLSRDRRAEALDAEAVAMLETLRADPAGDWRGQGDPFPLGRTFKLRSERQLGASFGPGFAVEAAKLPVGVWAGPVESAYGKHLVRVTEAEAERMPSVDALQNQLRHRLLAERREETLQDMVEDLRSQYEIFVEYPDQRGKVPADVALQG